MAPLFLPSGKSNSIPHHSPDSKCVGPIYRKIPRFSPKITTLSPMSFEVTAVTSLEGWWGRRGAVGIGNLLDSGIWKNILNIIFLILWIVFENNVFIFFIESTLLLRSKTAYVYFFAENCFYLCSNECLTLIGWLDIRTKFLLVEWNLERIIILARKFKLHNTCNLHTNGKKHLERKLLPSIYIYILRSYKCQNELFNSLFLRLNKDNIIDSGLRKKCIIQTFPSNFEIQIG